MFGEKAEALVDATPPPELGEAVRDLKAIDRTGVSTLIARLLRLADRGALGGLARAGIVSAIDGDQRRERLDDCEIYLERTTGSYPRQPGPYYSTSVQPARGAAFYGTYGQQMVLVPVMVPIPQRAIVREYVTEEIID